MREQVKILQERLHTTNADGRRSTQVHADTANTALEMNRLKDTVESMMSELRNTDMEKKQLELRVDGLKSHRADVMARSKDLERELEKARGESEVLRNRLAAADTEQALQRHFVESAQRQAELVTCFLERIPARGDLLLQKRFLKTPFSFLLWGER